MLIGQIEVMVAVICEVCGDIFDYHTDRFVDASEIKAEMEEDFDWKYIDGKFICDACVEELERIIFNPS